MLTEIQSLRYIGQQPRSDPFMMLLDEAPFQPADDDDDDDAVAVAVADAGDGDGDGDGDAMVMMMIKK